MIKRLCILISHPIQYYSPVFKQLSSLPNTELKVFYSLGDQKFEDKGFLQEIVWDLPLLSGYNYEFLKNTSSNPGSDRFLGIINPDIIERISNFKPDILMVFGWAYCSHQKAIQHFGKKIPIWFRGDSTLLDKRPYWKTILRKLCLKHVYNNVDKAFYVGSNNKEYFEYFGLKSSQLVFAPHAVDNKRFAENRSFEAEEIRKFIKVPPDCLLVLFAGKFEKKKNPEILLEAFIELNIPNTHLLFVGNGELRATLTNNVNLGRASQIHFMDFQNQTKMPVLYQACDIFCLPSRGPNETWGLSVNEAMAAGKAVLASNKVGCASDLIIDGENGYIFESENKNDLKEKLALLCSNFERLKKMGASSASKVRDWSFEIQVEQFNMELKKYE